MKGHLKLAAAIAICTASVFWPAPGHSHETLTTTVLFDREIVRVLNKHCVMCHVENGPAFPLATYEQTWLQGRAIRADVIARHMPPWAAVPGYGRFANDNSLTLREVQFVVSWVEGLGPRNAGTVFRNVAAADAAPRKAVRASTDFENWQLGTPDLMRDVPPQAIDASQAVGTARATIDLGIVAERRIRGIEYKPGDRRQVRAADFHVQETGQWLGSWTPWYGFMSLPAGVFLRLPAGSHLVADIHYTDGGQAILAGGSIGLFFAGPSAARPATQLVLDNRNVAAARSVGAIRGERVLTADVEALAVSVDGVEDLQSLEVTARSPDGRTDVLLFAKDFPAGWPTPYVMKEPVRLPRGSRLSFTAYRKGNSTPNIRLMVAERAPGPSRGRGAE